MKKLHRSTKEKKIAGICGGFGEYFSVDPTLVRVITVVLAVCTGVFPLILVYLVAWWIIPQGP